ncbi:MAG: pentapeptide repeat-containing protein [SAR202 cluster bacterium]|nr:pentapeptide repeat-containing protein [SAR202 cluster bacterium]
MRKLAIVVLGVVSVLAFACTSSAASEPTAESGATPTQVGKVTDHLTIKEAVTGEGTPVNAAGTPNVVPFPEYIGDCKIERNTNCEGADMRNADLAGYRAQGFAPPVQADLRGANLMNADLSGATLAKAKMDGANLRGAKLVGTNLTETTLYKADLRDADLTRANLTFSDMEDALLDGAIFCETIMPKGEVNNEGC